MVPGEGRGGGGGVHIQGDERIWLWRGSAERCLMYV